MAHQPVELSGKLATKPHVRPSAHLCISTVLQTDCRPRREWAVATTMRARVLNVPLTQVEATVAAPGAMGTASGGIMNAPGQTLVWIMISATFHLIICYSIFFVNDGFIKISIYFAYPLQWIAEATTPNPVRGVHSTWVVQVAVGHGATGSASGWTAPAPRGRSTAVSGFFTEIADHTTHVHFKYRDYIYRGGH